MRRNTTILVVEDDAAIARGLSALLQTEGYSAVVAANGSQALRKTPEVQPSLVLLDLNLPDISGIEVCRALRKSGFINPIIMLTARSEQADKLIGLEVGADDYMTKPFDPREVVARVRSHVRMMERLPEKPPPSGNTLRRRLLAVMFTDMKDYSKLMNRDETLALETLDVHNRLLTKAITRHKGRVVEVIGDAFVAAFDSALSAVDCGVMIQQELRKLNQKRKAGQHIHVRIGIHVGDVLEMDGKLKGDTVNIAARLQQLATPGTVSISQHVLDFLKGKAKLNIMKRGTRRLKNIREPLMVYSVNP